MNRRSELKAAAQAAPPAPASPLRARIRETTVQAILAAAEEVFADAGLHAAHMDTIAAKAGVSVGTLYNHFEDREALLAGLLAARHADLIGKVDAAIRVAAVRPLRDRLRGILGAFCAHYEAHKKFVQVVLQREVGRSQQASAQASSQSWAKKSDTMREIYERLEAEMKRGAKERALRPETAELAATFFFGMLRALIIRDFVFDAGGDMAADSEQLLDVFFNGMGSGSGSGARRPAP